MLPEAPLAPPAPPLPGWAPLPALHASAQHDAKSTNGPHISGDSDGHFMMNLVLSASVASRPVAEASDFESYPGRAR
jgi:hypothetical protein